MRHRQAVAPAHTGSNTVGGTAYKYYLTPYTFTPNIVTDPRYSPSRSPRARPSEPDDSSSAVVPRSRPSPTDYATQCQPSPQLASGHAAREHLWGQRRASGILCHCFDQTPVSLVREAQPAMSCADASLPLPLAMSQTSTPCVRTKVGTSPASMSAPA